MPQIEVTFDIDANGIVHVSAKDLGTNKEQNITITASSNLKEEDINKAVKEAEEYAEQDKKRKELVDVKNQCDGMILAIEKLLRENGDKISEDDKKKLNEALEKAKEGMKSDNVDDVRKAIDELSKESGDVVSKLYQTASANANEGEQASASNENKDDEIIVDEKDYQEKKDENTENK